MKMTLPRAILPAAAALWAAAIPGPVALAAPPRGALDEAAARAFVARQEAAWNRRDDAGYFATFTPGAVFVEQARTNTNEVLRYGSSTLAEARRHTRRYFAGRPAQDRTTVLRVEIAPDRRTARVFAEKVSAGSAQPRCAETVQTLVAGPRSILSEGEIATSVRCPPPVRPGRR